MSAPTKPIDESACRSLLPSDKYDDLEAVIWFIHVTNRSKTKKGGDILEALREDLVKHAVAKDEAIRYLDKNTRNRHVPALAPRDAAHRIAELEKQVDKLTEDLANVRTIRDWVHEANKSLRRRVAELEVQVAEMQARNQLAREEAEANHQLERLDAARDRVRGKMVAVETLERVEVLREEQGRRRFWS